MDDTLPTAVLLIAHGTVESLDELPEFLANIRRGHAAPPELIAEVRRRYEAIGGRSPLLDITYEAATKLSKSLDLPVRVAMRLFRPYPKDVIRELVTGGIRRLLVVPLAQHSAPVYEAAVRAAARDVDPALEVRAAGNWGRTPRLTEAFADAVEGALRTIPPEAAEETALVLTAHSLPVNVIRGGDPYEREFRGSAEDVVAALQKRGTTNFAEHVIAFQSQGIGTGMEWLGPDLRSTLEALAARGRRRVVVAPIGFLADHVEILYDLDIEAKTWAEELGIVLVRSTSLNTTDGLVQALATVAREIAGG